MFDGKDFKKRKRLSLELADIVGKKEVIFIYSEKATKLCKISTLDLTITT